MGLGAKTQVSCGSMSFLTSSSLRVGACLMLFLGGCTSSTNKSDAVALKKQASDKAAADKKAKEDKAEHAAMAAAAQEAEQAQRDSLYEAAKEGLEPLAQLPKKHPKGFANACIEMLAAYDTFMKKSLTPRALAGWDAAKDNRERVMRRACHLRPVDAVVCETAVLKKAPEKTVLEHIIRLCGEKFE